MPIEAGGEASQHMALIAQLLSFLEDNDRAERILRRVIHSARVASAPSLLPFPLAALAEHELRVGRVAAAHAAAQESVRLVNETGQSAGVAFSLVTLARVEAILGLEELCREHVATARAMARRVGAATIDWYGESVLGLLDLSLGNLQEAYAHSAEKPRLERKIEVGLPVIVPLRPDLIEAAIRLGRIDDATRELEILERQGRRTGVSWAKATAARCRGLIDDEASYQRRSQRRWSSTGTRHPGSGREPSSASANADAARAAAPMPGQACSRRSPPSSRSVRIRGRRRPEGAARDGDDRRGRQ